MKNDETRRVSLIYYDGNEICVHSKKWRALFSSHIVPYQPFLLGKLSSEQLRISSEASKQAYSIKTKKGWELNIFDLLTYIMGVCDLAGRNYNSTLTIILLSDLSIQKLYFSNNAWTQRVINARRSTSHHRRRWAERFGIKTLRLIKGYRYLVWWSTGIGTHLVSIHGGRVAKALAFYATLEVTGLCPTFGGISEIYFSNRYSLRHGGT